MTREDKDTVIAAIKGCFGDTVYQVMEQGTFIRKATDAINAMPETTDDALKEVERPTARLALAERVMRNLAKVLCSPRYDRGDGCGDEEKLLARYGWTKEDTE